jgi:hypothetical protein
MDAIKTNYKYNFDKAENDTFSWDQFDGTSGNTLKYKPTGRRIYQMTWTDTKETVSDEIKQAAIEFWDELKSLKNQKPSKQAPSVVVVDHGFDNSNEPAHGHMGYCRKCHDYCYGDCDANGY